MKKLVFKPFVVEQFFGEHEIMFAGLDEIIEIKHTALSKDVFVQGALAAAKALQDKEVGLFTLKTLY